MCVCSKINCLNFSLLLAIKNSELKSFKDLLKLLRMNGFFDIEYSNTLLGRINSESAVFKKGMIAKFAYDK